MLASGAKPEPRVVTRITFQEDQRRAGPCRLGQRVPDQAAADALPLAFGNHADRAEHQHLDQLPRRIQPRPGQLRVPGQAAIRFGHERQPGRAGRAVLQRLSQVNHLGPAEGPDDDLADRGSLTRTLSTDDQVGRAWSMRTAHTTHRSDLARPFRTRTRRGCALAAG